MKQVTLNFAPGDSFWIMLREVKYRKTETICTKCNGVGYFELKDDSQLKCTACRDGIVRKEKAMYFAKPRKELCEQMVVGSDFQVIIYGDDRYGHEQRVNVREAFETKAECQTACDEHNASQKWK